MWYNPALAYESNAKGKTDASSFFQGTLARMALTVVFS
jgi:hypothetical protein